MVMDHSVGSFDRYFPYVVFSGCFYQYPFISRPGKPANDLATELISEDGVVIATYHIETVLMYNTKICQAPKHATIATEDIRFYGIPV